MTQPRRLQSQQKNIAQATYADPVSTMMASLLPVHGALTIEWLVDAACTAAERGLNAPYTFFFLEDSTGVLEHRAPASDLRRRSQQRAIDALGGRIFRSRVDPASVPALAEALDGGSPVTVPLGELFAPLVGEERAGTARVELNCQYACATPLQTAGERIGALLVLLHTEEDENHVRLLAEHIASAAVNLRQVQSAREQNVIDIVRSVFDARKLESELQRELGRAQRYRRDLSIAVIEATNLRLLREQFGAFLTERLLQRLGEALAQHSREIDVLGSYKESGYTMILTEAASEGAATAVRRLLETASSVRLDEEVPGLELHLAGGHATCPADGITSDALFAAAERRMYGSASQVA